MVEEDKKCNCVEKNVEKSQIGMGKGKGEWQGDNGRLNSPSARFTNFSDVILASIVLLPVNLLHTFKQL
jgi:hypothetical protein